MADREKQPPKDVHILIPGTCEYISLHGKRNFVGVIKLRILDGDLSLEYPGRLDVITKVLSYEREVDQRREKIPYSRL